MITPFSFHAYLKYIDYGSFSDTNYEIMYRNTCMSQSQYFLLCGDMKMFTVTPTDMNKRKEFMWNGNIVTVITAYQHFFMHNC